MPYKYNKNYVPYKNNNFSAKLPMASPSANFDKQIKSYVEKQAEKVLMKKLSSKTKNKTNLKQKKSFGSKSKVYNTTGSYQGKFKEPMRKKVPLNNNFKSIEWGSTLSDANAVYIGMTNAPFREVLRAVCRAIVQELFRQIGQSITSWDLELSATASARYNIICEYYSSPLDNTIESFTYSIADTAETFNVIANGLQAAFNSNFSVSAPHELIRIYLDDRKVGASNIVQASIDAQAFKFTLNMLSQLVVQNQTLASQGDTAVDNEMTSIENNPLEGRLFQSNTCTGLQYRYRTDADASVWTSLIGDPRTGIISAKAAEQASSFSKKIPNRKVFKSCSYSSNVRLAPGAIKKYSLKSVSKFSLQSFFNKYYAIINESLVATTTTNLVPLYGLGKCAVLGLEKMLDSRVTESVVSIAWEVRHHIGINYSHNNRKAPLPIVEVN